MKKNNKLKNTRSSWHTFILVLKFTSFTIDCLSKCVNSILRSKNTQINNEKENYSNSERHFQKHIPSNYRTITCLRLVWKITITYIGVEIHFSLECCGLFLEGQKNTTSERGEQINYSIETSTTSRRSKQDGNVDPAWIDNKKAYYMTSEIFKISNEDIIFISKDWKMKSTAGK